MNETKNKELRKPDPAIATKYFYELADNLANMLAVFRGIVGTSLELVDEQQSACVLAKDLLMRLGAVDDYVLYGVDGPPEGE